MRRPLLLVAVLFVAGCGKKGPECESLVKVINPAVEKMNKATGVKQEKNDALIQQAKDIAGIASGTASGLAALPLTVPELKKFSADYQAMAKEISAAASTTADVLKRADEAAKASEKADKQTDEAGEKLVKGCATAKDPGDLEICKKTGEVLKKLPDDLSQATGLGATANELEREPFKDAELAAAVKSVASALRATEKVLQEYKAVQQKAKEAQASMDAATKREEPLIDGVNKFCSGG